MYYLGPGRSAGYAVFNLGAEYEGRRQVISGLSRGERIVVDSLVRRRAAEKALFLTPDNGQFVAAPSPLLRPVIDLDALDLVPLRRPVEVLNLSRVRPSTSCASTSYVPRASYSS